MSTATEPQSQWDLGAIGRWSQPTSFEVTAERIAAYAEATNDEHPRHASGELAPPIFSFVPASEPLLASMLEPVPEPLKMRGVHGQQDFRYHAPIEPGQMLLTRAGVTGIAARSTGVVVLGRTESRDQEGRLVTEGTMTYFVRGAEIESSHGDPLPEHPFPDEVREREPLARVEHGYDPDQTQRYSKAAGDPMPIHLDDEFARKMGLPGIIVHGLCTMAFCSRAVIAAGCSDDPTRLKRLAVRFASIVQPSETVTTSVWDAGETDAGLRRLVFETVSDNGNVAIKDGIAEID